MAVPPVTAAIVVSQVGWTPPGGYASGSADGLSIGQVVTLANASDANVLTHRWEFYGCPLNAPGSYGLSALSAATVTATPTLAGDCKVRLTVEGPNLDNGAPNIAVAEAMLGIRQPSGGYPAGIPIPHPLESGVGGRCTFDAASGGARRIAEVAKAVASASGGDSKLWYGQGDQATAANTTTTATNATVGMRFRVFRAATLTGVRVWVKSAGGSKSVKVCLWDDNSSALLKTATLAGCASDSLHDVLFSSSYALSPALLYVVSAYITDGSGYVQLADVLNPGAANTAYLAGPNVYVAHPGLGTGGDAFPSGAYTQCALQPVFA